MSVVRKQLGSTNVQLSALGFGAAPIGNLYTEVDEGDALAAVAGAFEAGIRHFDSAPYYGYGLSETRLGRGLAGVPRAAYTLSTKVGRCLYDDAQAAAGRDGFAVAGRRAAFDYSGDGVRRAFASSLERLGTDYIDVLLLHDIGTLTHGDNHANVLRQALEEALPAMAALKAAGACGAIGLGVNEQEVALEVLPRFPLDCVMLAGRYTLLEQHGARALLDQAQQRNVAILSAGPYSSGLLSDARGPGATYNYAPVDTATCSTRSACTLPARRSMWISVQWRCSSAGASGSDHRGGRHAHRGRGAIGRHAPADIDSASAVATPAR